MHCKKTFVIIALILLVMFIGTSIWYTTGRNNKRIKEQQLSLFGLDWPYPISALYDLSIDDFITEFGQPDKIELQNKYNDDIIYSTLVYNGFCVNYMHSTSCDDSRFANIMITTTNIKLWRDNICLGSPRVQVETAFSKVPKDQSTSNAYFDTVWGIMFIYSDENLVQEIILYPPW